jgi:hypothetical protein
MPLWSNLIKRLYNDTAVPILPGKDLNYSTASLKAQTEPNCPWISPTSPQKIFPLLCIVQRIRITSFVSLRGSKFTHSYASSAFISVISSSANKPPGNSRKYAVYPRFNLSLLKIIQVTDEFLFREVNITCVEVWTLRDIQTYPHPKANFSPGPSIVATCEISLQLPHPIDC